MCYYGFENEDEENAIEDVFAFIIIPLCLIALILLTVDAMWDWSYFRKYQAASHTIRWYFCLIFVFNWKTLRNPRGEYIGNDS